jgi:predicted enzyme related to lactoylglutathione lyase
MSSPNSPVGSVVWRDLTVPDAKALCTFYERVVGWSSAEHDMGDYVDYEMKEPASGTTVAGICHARGTNAGLPPQWLVYVVVADVEEAARRCREGGGEVVDGPRSMGAKAFCVIRDPAGAVLGLIEG